MIIKRIKLAVVIIFIPLVLFSGDAVEELEKQLNEPSISGIEKVRLLTRLSELTQDSEPTKAVRASKEALELLGQLDDPSLEVRVLLALTWAAQNIGEYETALKYGNRAEKRALEIKDKKSAAVAYNHISRINDQLGFLDRALEYALRALKLFEELGDKKNLSEAYKNIGNVYTNLRNSKLALTYYIKSLGILEELGDKKGVARLLNNIGIIYSDSGQHEKAMENYKKSLSLVKELNWQMGQVVAMNNIATVYSETGKHTLSLEYNLKALEISKGLGQKRNTAILLSNIGVNYRQLGQHNKALRYVYNALDIANEIKNKDIIRNFFEELSYIYEAMKDYQQAFFYLKKYKATDDEILSEEARKNISELWTKFETEKKEKKIQSLTQHNRIQQLKLERQELLRNFLLVVSLLILVLFIVIYSRYRTEKKAERQLKESAQKLRAMNISKDKLFSIIAHDLGSPLNSILLSSGFLEKKYQTLEEEEVRDLLHQIYENTDHMAKLLDNLLKWAVSQLGKLEVELETLDLSQLTEDTIELMMSTAREKNIHLVSHINKNTLAHADKRMVETILRNLLSNAIKYTENGGEVHVFSKNDENFLEIAVADSGVGIPTDKLNSLFDLGVHNSTRGTAGEKGTGLGLVLCKEFVEKNRGTIRVEKNTNNETRTGTRVTFTLPTAPQEKKKTTPIAETLL
jgi:signal transduction histidine kinase